MTWASDLDFNLGAGTSSRVGELLTILASPVTADTIFGIFPYGIDTLSNYRQLIPTNTALTLETAGATGGEGAVKVKMRYEILDTTNF